MRRAGFILLLRFGYGCDGGNAYIVEGVVVEVHGEQEVVIAHNEVKGLMGAMTMPFAVRDPELLEGVSPGDEVVARLIISDRSYLSQLRVVGHGEAPRLDSAAVPVRLPLRPGEILPRTEIIAEDGSKLMVGEGQGIATALGFLYTQCPVPEFCPALVARFASLQHRVGPGVRLVAVTLDPEHDTLDVLREFAGRSGARPDVWRLARAEPPVLAELAAQAALSVSREGDTLLHAARLLLLDPRGRLIERYDDNRWPIERVVTQLQTGQPSAPVGSSGTVSP